MFHLNTTMSQMFQIKAIPQIQYQFLWDMIMINVYFVLDIFRHHSGLIFVLTLEDDTSRMH